MTKRRKPPEAPTVAALDKADFELLDYLVVKAVESLVPPASKPSSPSSPPTTRSYRRRDQPERTVDASNEVNRAAASHDEPLRSSEAPWSLPVRQSVVRATFLRLADEKVSENARRLLSWTAYHLTTSEHADVVLLTRQVLASDVGLSASDCAAALDELVEHRFVQEERALSNHRQVALRLLVEGVNAPRRKPSAR